ncbi:MAG: RNA methyltransferase [Bacteroidaceae bacterium]|nr:RNA methyltransferase [Bacteroidaceae bacterium]MBQ8362281.1 RNA methyltransferase [Bacteroidaceae bacterium]
MRKLSITEMKRISAEEFRLSEKIPLVVVLDEVRSLHNVGSVFRTSDAFKVERICLCGITATPPHPEMHKTALGAEDTVAWTYHTDTSDVIGQLHAAGYTVFAIEQCEGSTMLQDIALSSEGKYAVVLGNEVKGVKQEVVNACDGCIEIPQFGTKHSLNVSVTAGIIIWEFARRIMKL